MAKLNFKINAKSENSTKTVVRARDFKIIIDEPKDLGGTDDGANPVEYILAALSGCLNVVGHIVAKELGMNLKGIKIEMEGELDPAKFLGQVTNNRAGYERITVKINPDTDADSQTLDKWLEGVENRCPVSDNIMNNTPVTIELVKLIL